jgi:hypothetical protein
MIAAAPGHAKAQPRSAAGNQHHMVFEQGQ